MRVLIVGEPQPARERLARLVGAAHRDVTIADLETCERGIAHRPPDVLLVVLPQTGSGDLVRSLIAADRAGGMYVISVTNEQHPSRVIASAFAAGSHDVLCAPYSDAELYGRIDVMRRLRGWSTARARIDPQPPPLAVRDSRAWHYLGDIVADDFEAMFGRPLCLDESWPTFTTSSRVATIALTLAAEQLDLRVSVIADEVARQWLGSHLLGDANASAESIDDAMRELANVAGGALKRAALVEGPILSAGIPVNGQTVPERGKDARCWTISLAPGISLAIVGDINRRPNRRLAARRLIEGMVVTADIVNTGGVLLLLAGTRLTETTVQRLGNLLGTKTVEISG
ncbi:MAG TPA: hypothetical protein VGO00_05395 [Kofleriaceae bacterium]|nr:hypothetical protein [Kofleriaceae bacterium]